MKSFGAGLTTALASGNAPLATCWTITRVDGTLERYTDHPQDLNVAGNVYATLPGIQRTAIALSASASPDGLTVQGAVGDDPALTLAKLLGEDYAGAAVEVFLVPWDDTTLGTIPLVGRALADVVVRRGGFEAQVRGHAQELATVFGLLSSLHCRAQLGDAECGVDLSDPSLTVSATITGASSSRRVFDASDLTQGDGYFDEGVLTWTSREHTTRTARVKRYTVGHIELALPDARDLRNGMTFDVAVGCDKRRETCRDKFANIVNFRGEPYLPGADALLQAPCHGDA